MKITPKKVAIVLTMLLSVAGAIYAPVGEYVDSFKAEMCAPSEAPVEDAADAGTDVE